VHPKNSEESPEREPWEGNLQLTARKGYFDLGTSKGYGTMRVHFRDVDGRLRPWKVEVSVTDANVAVTSRMLATAPLVEAEAAANLRPLTAKAATASSAKADLTVTRAVRSLVVPDIRPYPETFWQDVAAIYVRLVIVDGVTNPAVWIAEDTGVPIPTVRGWIAKCRELGLLAKGSQGRLG
jgi:hypothetical protein